MSGPRLPHELLAVAAAATGVFFARARLPHTLPLGLLLLAGALLLLAQGFLRDLARLAAKARSSSSREVTCICVESVVGLVTIVAGVAFTFACTSVRVSIGATAWPIAFGCVCLFGTFTREIVFDWRALRFRRELDHGSRVVWRAAP